ncbi:SDR family oxidoreductase [Acidithiobacillus caldus]|uniref:SDR family oxidoreductase n=1 Tax=Acidithiobacillus caldus TaxID=33059 RepID=UPI001C07E3B0|nr:SDR family oxidoreductase [Acidithiobacillus caldus]
MDKLLITGSTGMLGGYVMSEVDRNKWSIIAPTRSMFNLDEPSLLYDYIIANNPQIILHMAAETDVDQCEIDPHIAARRNALSTQEIARAARKCGAYLLYISTSNIFSSSERLIFNELDVPSPCNYYGKSKFFGEKVIENSGPSDYLIIRAGWMIGGGRQKDHKFVGRIIKAIDNNAEEIRAVNDRIGSITYAHLLSKFIRWALDNKPTGIIHYSSTGAISRYEIAVEIARILNFNGRVIPVSSPIFPLPAPRPLSDAIETIYLSVMNGAPISGSWREDLETYVRTFINTPSG